MSGINNDVGLSPLARGTLPFARHQIGEKRFIPAGAGNTTSRAKSRAEFSVYPRWRGEHRSTVQNPSRYFGLSPLARGTPSPRSGDAHAERFIPAGAGNTPVRAVTALASAVYPRWRGEHPFAGAETSTVAGLSPLARGTLYQLSSTGLICRFIPAGAGNTFQPGWRWCGIAVYPRWRGEHAKHGNLSRQNDRFIPAGAGNT